MQAALAKYGKYGRFGAGVLDKAGAIAGGTLLEPFENSSLEISSGLFSAIKQDLPGPDWDKVIAREKAALGDYASVTAALTVTMGLGRRAEQIFDRYRLRKQLSDRRELELTGVGKKAAKKIALTAEQDPAAAADMLKDVVEATPVEQRRERARVVQEQVLQEQQQAPGPEDPADNPYRNGDGTLRIPERASSRHDPALAPQEQRLIRTLNNAGQADALYDALPDAKGGKVIGTDIVRELLPEYAAGREGRLLYTHATGRASQAYAKDRLWREIQNRNGRQSLMFTAGGVAAGKSTVVTDEMVNANDLVFDGTLRETDWAIQTIEQALKDGWENISILSIQRPIDLVAQGAIDRAEQTGRWGSISDLPAIHLEAQRSIIEIAKHFKDEPKVEIQFWLNAGKAKGEAPTKLTLAQIDTGGEQSYFESHDRRGTETTSGKDSSGSSERFRAAARERVVTRFFEAIHSGKYSPEVLARLAQGDAELEGLLREAGIPLEP